MQRLFIAFILAGASGCFGQILAATHEELRIEAEQRIAVVHHGLDALLTPTPSERELHAACAVNCASRTQEVQDGLRKITSARMEAMDGLISQAGPNIRMRIYAYNGTEFRTVWAPENVWGSFTVQVTERGFRVDGDYYRELRERHDSYCLSPNEVYRVPNQ
jgi:hypothetical protein